MMGAHFAQCSECVCTPARVCVGGGGRQIGEGAALPSMESVCPSPQRVCSMFVYVHLTVLHANWIHLPLLRCMLLELYFQCTWAACMILAQLACCFAADL